MRELDPEEARAVIDPVLQLMMDAVHCYDGYVVQSAGDGIFALFGAPVAHEDHPQRAVHAAIAMRDALCRRAGDLAAHRRRARTGSRASFGLGRLSYRVATVRQVGACQSLGRRLASGEPSAWLAALYGRPLGLHG